MKTYKVIYCDIEVQTNNKLRAALTILLHPNCWRTRKIRFTHLGKAVAKTKVKPRITLIKV